MIFEMSQVEEIAGLVMSTLDEVVKIDRDEQRRQRDREDCRRYYRKHLVKETARRKAYQAKNRDNLVRKQRETRHSEDGLIQVCRMRIYALRKRAKANGWPRLDFDAQWLMNRFNEIDRKCVICYRSLPVCGSNKNDPSCWSVDRIDNDKPYMTANVEIICLRCNTVKRDGSAEEHRKIADFMASRGAK